MSKLVQIQWSESVFSFDHDALGGFLVGSIYICIRISLF